MIWGQSATDGSTVGIDIKAQLLDAAGAEVSWPFVLNQQNEGDQFPAAVDGLPGGGFVVIWNQLFSEPDTPLDVHAQAFELSGAKSGPNSSSTHHWAGSRSAPAVEVLASGDMVVAWTLAPSANEADVSLQLLTALTTPPYKIAVSHVTVSETAIENLAVATLERIGRCAQFEPQLRDRHRFHPWRFRHRRRPVVVVDNGRLDFETAQRHKCGPGDR